MKRSMIAMVSMVAVLFIAGMAQAVPEWRTITFTGADMFNYTTTVAPRADQADPRRLRVYDANGNMTQQLQSDGDANLNGINNFAEWAAGSPTGYAFSYFNLSGYTSPPGGWGQKYQAVAGSGSANNYGADSWRNQTVNGVAVINSMGSASGWAGGIVGTNQAGTDGANFAFPVWRAPTGTQLTMANAAGWTFSVEVLLENPDTAFESDGSLRVFFGGSNFPQDFAGPSWHVAGIVDGAPVPEPLTVLGVIAGVGGVAGYIRKRRAAV